MSFFKSKTREPEYVEPIIAISTPVQIKKHECSDLENIKYTARTDVNGTKVKADFTRYIGPDDYYYSSVSEAQALEILRGRLYDAVEFQKQRDLELPFGKWMAVNWDEDSLSTGKG